MFTWKGVWCSVYSTIHNNDILISNLLNYKTELPVSRVIHNLERPGSVSYRIQSGDTCLPELYDIKSATWCYLCPWAILTTTLSYPFSKCFWFKVSVTCLSELFRLQSCATSIPYLSCLQPAAISLLKLSDLQHVTIWPHEMFHTYGICSNLPSWVTYNLELPVSVSYLILYSLEHP